VRPQRCRANADGPQEVPPCRACGCEGSGPPCWWTPRRRALPVVRHWGPAPPAAEDAASVAGALTPAQTNASIDERVHLDLCPGQPSGFQGTPGLRGAFGDGTGWAPRWSRVGLEHDERRLLVAAEDAAAGLALHVEVTIDAHDVVAVRAAVTNRRDGAATDASTFPSATPGLGAGPRAGRRPSPTTSTRCADLAGPRRRRRGRDVRGAVVAGAAPAAPAVDRRPVRARDGAGTLVARGPADPVRGHPRVRGGTRAGVGLPPGLGGQPRGAGRADRRRVRASCRRASSSTRGDRGGTRRDLRDAAAARDRVVERA
jgi:hypothetical protein